MNLSGYNKLLNAIWYESIWFIAVLGGAAWTGALIALLCLHIVLCEARKQEVLMMLTGTLVGLSIDTSLTLLGVFEFTPTTDLLPVPFWLAAIWLGFCGTLRHSMAFMTARPKLMVIMATFFAPLSYVAAMKLGAVYFPLGTVKTALIVGACWAIIVPILLVINQILMPSKPTKHHKDASPSLTFNFTVDQE